MIPLSPADRINIVHRTRAAMGTALTSTFSLSGGARPSERSLAERWLAEMRRHSELLPDGWYQPPPHGLSVLIGQPAGYERLIYKSLRDPGIWPRDNNALLPNALVYVYASPTDRVSALIGDLGATLYSGADPVIRDHLACCLHVSTEVALYAQPGMELRELYHYAQQMISDVSSDLRNYCTSITDFGRSNIGHTVPWSYDDYSAADIRCIDSGSMADIADLVSKKRVFLSAQNRLQIQPDMAFTIEPRIRSDSLPLASFHLIVTFTAGRKAICSEFDGVFSAFGMDRYLPSQTLIRLDELRPKT